MINSVVVLQVISMEWGNFYSPNFPSTLYDDILDAESSDPGGRV